MKKLIMTALVCLSVIGIAGVAAGSSLAASAPTPKATGDIYFNNTGYGLDRPVPAHWVFNAIGGTSAKGSVSYQDEFGSYTGNVTNVTPLKGDTHAMTFTAVVTSSTSQGTLAGDSFTWTVHDNGEGSNATAADYFTYDGAVLGGTIYPGTGSTPYPITAGNIQVSF